MLLFRRQGFVADMLEKNVFQLLLRLESRGPPSGRSAPF